MRETKQTRRPGTRTVIAAVLVFWILLPVPAWACLHIRGGHVAKDRITMIAAWHEGIEDLVVHYDYSASEAPETIAFVLPLPSPPTQYDVVDADDVAALRTHVGVFRKAPRSPLIGMERPLKLLQKASAGPYEIQPIEARGQAGADALRKWLEDNGFGRFPMEASRYYADRGWTFLAIRTKPHEPGTLNELPALHVRFPSRRLVLPFKLLLSESIMLKTESFVLTGRPLGTESIQDALDRGFEVLNEDRMNSPAIIGELVMRRGKLASSEVDPRVGRLVSSFAISELREISVAHLRSTPHRTRSLIPPESDDERDEKRRKAWDEDLSFPPLPAGERLLGGSKMPPAPRVEAKSSGDLPPWPTQVPGETADAGTINGSSDPTTTDCKGCSSGGGSPGPLGLLLVGLFGARVAGRRSRAR